MSTPSLITKDTVKASAKTNFDNPVFVLQYPGGKIYEVLTDLDLAYKKYNQDELLALDICELNEENQ